MKLNRKFDHLNSNLSLKSIFLILLSLIVVFSSGIFFDHAEAVVVESGPKLTQVGPINDVNGFPLWYKDSNGVKLELCLEGPYCLNEDGLPNPNAPMSFPDNYPGEAFYQLAEAVMPVGTNGTALGTFALEATFNGEVPAVGDQTVFGRIRFRIDGLNPNTEYTITHPYGKDRLTSDALGEINYTEDIGIGGGFERALTSRIGTFLKWDTGAPEGYIGDPNVPHKITGGVNNQNFFQVEGPSIGIIKTDQFSLMGKISVNGGFTDLGEFTWAWDSIDYLVEKGVINGVGNNKFNPSGWLTRGEAAKIIALTLPLSVDLNARTDFVDASNHWASPYITAIQTQRPGVIDGFPDGTFHPDEFVTREQFAKMLVVAYGLEKNVAGPNIQFQDVSGWATDYIYILASNNIVNGKAQGIFAPQDNVNRAEGVTMIYRTEVPSTANIN